MLSHFKHLFEGSNHNAQSSKLTLAEGHNQGKLEQLVAEHENDALGKLGASDAYVSENPAVAKSQPNRVSRLVDREQ